MKKVNLLLVYLLSFVYLEFLYRIFLYKNVFRLSNINMLLFLVFFSLFNFLVSKLWKEKGNKVIFYIIMTFWSIWFSAQYVVKDFFDFYISFSVLQIADQVGDFMGTAVLEVAKRLLGIIFIFLPLILSIIFRKRLNFRRFKKEKSLIILGCCLLSFGIYYLGLNINKNIAYSPYILYHDINDPSLNIEKVGIVNTFVLDSFRAIFGFEEKLNLVTQKPNQNIDPNSQYKYNNFDFDFESLKKNTKDNTIKTMTSYFENETGTLENEYTNFFKGKNLILFMAESFNEIAVREDTTPTLYKLANNSFVFNNYYSPTIFSTIGGEFQELTGLYPASTAELATFRKGSNAFPMGIATLFKDAGYNTFAYHNNSYTFQDRNLYLKSLGFDNYKGCYNGIEKKVNCSLWPQSDVEMINATYEDYINSEKPFMVFYASVSGHAGYSFNGNAMARKHEQEIKALNLNYSEPVLAYLAAQMELDQALATLLTKLEEAGKLDDTVIALVGDHYPYALTAEQINEASSYKKDDTIEINHSKFILYNNKMEKVEVNKVGSQIDVLPTLYNLYGIKYDSRLIIGKDILSTEPGLAIFGNRSWVSDKGKYFSSSGKAILDDDAPSGYVKDMNIIVNNKIQMSKYIINKNYYKLAWQYKK